jgi:hypothetical protein
VSKPSTPQTSPGSWLFAASFVLLGLAGALAKGHWEAFPFWALTGALLSPLSHRYRWEFTIFACLTGLGYIAFYESQNETLYAALNGALCLGLALLVSPSSDPLIDPWIQRRIERRAAKSGRPR